MVLKDTEEFEEFVCYLDERFWEECINGEDVLPEEFWGFSIDELGAKYTALQLAVVIGWSEKVDKCIARGDDIFECYVPEGWFPVRVSLPELGLAKGFDFTEELVSAGHSVELKKWLLATQHNDKLCNSLNDRWGEVKVS